MTLSFTIKVKLTATAIMIFLITSPRVEDMGYRMGLNGVDNAKLLFDNVRVPRENLLNKYSDVDESGKFHTTIANGRARFLTVADQVRAEGVCDYVNDCFFCLI